MLEGVGGQKGAHLRTPLMIVESSAQDDRLPVDGAEAVIEAPGLSTGAGLLRNLPRPLGSATGGARINGCSGGLAIGDGAKAASLRQNGVSARLEVDSGKETAGLTSLSTLLQRMQMAGSLGAAEDSRGDVPAGRH